MKPILKMPLAALLIFTLCTSSCSKKDSPPNPDTQTLLTAKTWSLVKQGADDNKNGAIDDAEFEPRGTSASDYEYLTLSPDGTFYETLPSGYISTHWELYDKSTIRIVVEHYGAAPSSLYWRIKTLSVNQLNIEEYDNVNKKLLHGMQFVPR